MINMADPQPKAKLEGSILISIMKRIGVDTDDLSENTSYAEDIMQAINSHIVALTQKGVGPREGFRIKDETATWEDLLEDHIDMDCAKEYVYLKTKLVFDPPTAASIESFNAMATEALVRCGYAVEGFTLT